MEAAVYSINVPKTVRSKKALLALVVEWIILILNMAITTVYLRELAFTVKITFYLPVKAPVSSQSCSALRYISMKSRTLSSSNVSLCSAILSRTKLFIWRSTFINFLNFGYNITHGASVILWHLCLFYIVMLIDMVSIIRVKYYTLKTHVRTHARTHARKHTHKHLHAYTYTNAFATCVVWWTHIYVYTLLTTSAKASGPGNQDAAAFLGPEFSKV